MRAIDLFAGAGGFTEGASQAGATVVWAANHSRLAVETHARNHPATIHRCQDLHQANWLEVPRHDCVLASPSCTGHSHSRGVDRPHHDAARATAWAVVSCLEVHRSRFAVIENVPAFLEWSLYPSWADALRRLGYQLEVNIRDCADHGVRQNRVRLVIIAAHGRKPPPYRNPQHVHRSAGEIIDWSDNAAWTPIDTRRRSERTKAKIQVARRAFGDRFFIPYYSRGSGLTGRSIHRPIGTLSTLARYAVVRGRHMRMLSIPETKELSSFRPDYELPTNIRAANFLLGNAFPPIAARDAVASVMAA